MRPEILNPLFAPIGKLQGIGPKLEKLITVLLKGSGQTAPANVVDLLWHLPSGLIDRRFQPKISEVIAGELATLKVTIGEHVPPPGNQRRLPYRVHCFDDTGTLDLIFFHSHTDYLQKQIPVGSVRYISGKIEVFRDIAQMPHPDHMVSQEEFDKLPLVEPVYPMTGGLARKTLQRSVSLALERVPQMPEWQDLAWKKKQKYQSFNEALVDAHAPTDHQNLEPNDPARLRLAYDELLANQLALGLVRAHMRRAAGRTISGTGELRARLLEILPFSLTRSQTQSVEEILKDMTTPERMMRLLQGDVGSGKTIVALLAMLAAVESGAQAAIMAPTEILCRQHFEMMEGLCRQLDVNVVILTGRDTGKARTALLEKIKSGAAQIIIGTHAIFQAGVEFKDLALAVIDEQHRFGVHQRLALQEKAGGGQALDLLVMTATPIPRTLTLTIYGDMDVSKLLEKPAGRLPVDTRVLPIARLSDVTGRLEHTLQQGAQVYWVCPLVEDSELLDLTSAEQRYESLKGLFGDRVGLIHGRMKGQEKDAVMERFRTSQLSILVATTVIEVGVDVPNATIMIIEHAERFGLAQLHQLRGRVGRGSNKSSCLLLYQSPLSETATKRLKIMRETEDGFLIAEEDLKLRGTGELLGTRQSGFAQFHIADLDAHSELLGAARDDATMIIAKDAKLESERGEALRILLYLFERNEAIKLLHAG